MSVKLELKYEFGEQHILVSRRAAGIPTLKAVSTVVVIEQTVYVDEYYYRIVGKGNTFNEAKEKFDKNLKHLFEKKVREGVLTEYYFKFVDDSIQGYVYEYYDEEDWL